MSDDLPMGWVKCNLEDISNLITKGTTPTTLGFQFLDIGIRFIKIENIKNKQIIRSSISSFISKEANETLKRSQLEENDILFSIAGTIGETCLVKQDDIPANTNQAVAIIRGTNFYCIPQFLLYQLSSESIKLLREKARGGAMNNISLGDLRTTQINLPPLNEQRRIVDKLDRIGDRQRSARNELNHIPKLIARYKQAVLAAACSGKLTEDWRETNNISFNWGRVKMAEIGYLGRGKSKHRPRNDSRLYGGIYPFIQTGDIAQSNGRIENHSQTYSEFGLSQSKLWEAGTVCITIAANIGDTAILSYPACFPDSVVGFVCDDKKCLPEFFKWSIDMISEDLESFAPATAQKNINLAILNDIELFCPPLEEQKEIVRRVEEMFEKIDRMEREYQQAAKLCDRLEQATLAKAFRGELVPQDPDDEPASVLLEQVKRERSKGKIKK
ncbi:restriction endonuclease subunit S [Pseudanabaena sp. FACHB-1277]|uniref:Restriction endonuclease subunit S n=1 Tax=Pseudanabaena cinerea FACHB-1277 TaxID=2949581 RepID=A0A926UPQ0_9CYAN|nr:restriction endonuclease subunit S [Pseudanabaena cinerea]MBD2148946.1 restriction endonuclease subunit S [Pseudanabaena cinerea FACHB-1277]